MPILINAHFFNAYCTNITEKSFTHFSHKNEGRDKGFNQNEHLSL